MLKLKKLSLLKLGCQLILFGLFSCVANAQPDIAMLKTSRQFHMKYYLSVPTNWSLQKNWPILISLESADKHFKENAVEFKRASGNLPFIIVTPFIVSNGNYGHGSVSVYPYTHDEWEQIDKMGNCEFDMNGLLSIIKEVQQKYNGQDKIYITGFEAGTHLLWALTFNHPEIIKVSIPVSGNYIGRCVNNNIRINKVAREQLHIHSLYGELDNNYKSFLQKQDKEARDKAMGLGFKNVSVAMVKNKGHERLAAEVLNYCYSLYMK